MELSILLRTSDFRGDHDAEVTFACAIKPGETVESLVNHLLKKDRYCDWIEIRLVKQEPPNAQS